MSDEVPPQAELLQRDWTCSRCGHADLVEVIGVSQASGEHVVRTLLNWSGEEDAVRLMAVARCPRCSKRDTGQSWYRAAWGALPYPLVVGVVFGLPISNQAREIRTLEELQITLMAGLALVGVAAVVWGLAMPLVRWRLLRRADTAVEFMM